MFDVIGFMSAIDQVRAQRHTTWHKVAQESNVDGLNLRRYRAGMQGMNVQTMAKLSLWAGLDAQQFVKQEVMV